jgi:hypothetical protein
MPEPITFFLSLLAIKGAVASTGTAAGASAAGAVTAGTVVAGTVGGAAIANKAVKAVKYGNEAYKLHEK